MSDSKVESSNGALNRRNFRQVATEACYAYFPVVGSVSSVIITTHVANPRILHR